MELYPEGPSILSELIQNADDARASSVKILYNTRSYGTKSLLGPKMADWQGPALYVYNDATFSNRDFNNLVKIGQASKLDRLVTTVSYCLSIYVCEREYIPLFSFFCAIFVYIYVISYSLKAICNIVIYSHIVICFIFSCFSL